MYGSPINVAVLASTWTHNGAFEDASIYNEATVPSLEQVEAWLEQFSQTIDLALSTEGFVTPLTNPTAMASAAAVVEGVVADLCHAAHRSGRFFTKKALESGTSPIITVRQELNAWVSGNAVGFRTLGVAIVVNAVGEHFASFDVL
jgi:hypothetical protein